MQARSSAPYPVRAFTGREFVSYEWRRVPDGHEQDAEDHPLLETRENEVLPATVVEVDATDAARELAEEHGIDLDDVVGTGADGRVLVSDVRAAIGE